MSSVNRYTNLGELVVLYSIRSRLYGIPHSTRVLVTKENISGNKAKVSLEFYPIDEVPFEGDPSVLLHPEYVMRNFRGITLDQTPSVSTCVRHLVGELLPDNERLVVTTEPI